METPIDEECWSVDEETFCYSSLGDLLDSNDDLEAGTTVYVGRPDRPEAERLFDVGYIIDMIGDRACDIAGEHAEDYPSVSKEATEELNMLIKSWINKHCPPTFYTVKDMREHVLTDEDIAK